MSRLGYIEKSYGNEFTSAIANTYGYLVLNGSNLPNNSIIIASPVNEFNDDIGSYSVLATDYQGKAVRLTYTISEGNGLYTNSNDVLRLNIDNYTIKDNNKKISINLNSIIDNKSIYLNSKGKFSVSTNDLKHIDTSSRGVYRIDEDTIKVFDNILSVQTANLDYSNDAGNQKGIGLGDGETIVSNNGIFSVKVDNLRKTSDTDNGLAFTSNEEVNIKNGIISINTDKLQKSSTEYFGIGKPDGNSIQLDADGAFKANINSFHEGTTTSRGLVRYNDISFSGDNGVLSVNKFSQISDNIYIAKDNLEKIKDKLEDIRYLLEEYDAGILRPSIFKFYCNNLLSYALKKPIQGERIEEMEPQIVSVELVINTNCPYNLNVQIENNEEPPIAVNEINVNDDYVYSGSMGLGIRYQSTEGKDIPIKISFICRNYSSTKKEFQLYTKAKITAACDADGNVFKDLIFTVVRYNSSYSEDIKGNFSEEISVNMNKLSENIAKINTNYGTISGDENNNYNHNTGGGGGGSTVIPSYDDDIDTGGEVVSGNVSRRLRINPTSLVFTHESGDDEKYALLTYTVNGEVIPTSEYASSLQYKITDTSGNIINNPPIATTIGNYDNGNNVKVKYTVRNE